MNPTHVFERSDGMSVYGTVLGSAYCGGYWFLPICSDMKTWMKEPVWVPFAMKVSV